MKQQTGSFIKRNLPFILFVVLMFSFRSSVADYYHVPTGSMEPTIQVGDRIVVNKSAYTLELPFTNVVLAQTGDIARGDIVVIQSSAADTRLVKRVVAIAGDTVSLSNNTLTVNDEHAVIHRLDNYVFQETMGDSQRSIQLLQLKTVKDLLNARLLSLACEEKANWENYFENDKIDLSNTVLNKTTVSSARLKTDITRHKTGICV